MNTNKIKTELDQIWEKHNGIDNELLSRKYCYPDIDNFKNCQVLFIGLNPSFDLNEGHKNEFTYTLNQEGNTHKYFHKIENLVNDKDYGILSWGHIDMLFFRETSSGKVTEMLKNNAGVSFIWEQLQITNKIIEIINPQIIVVTNTLARRFLGKEKDINNLNERKKNQWLNYDFEFNKKYGTDVIKTKGKLYNKPIFYTSMLSGKRAMDNGSFQRLKWHINYVINKLNIE